MGSQFRQHHSHMLSRHWPAAAFHFRFVCWRVNCICVLQTPYQSRVCRRVLFSGVNSGKQHCKSQFRGGASSRWSEVTSAYSTFVQSSSGRKTEGELPRWRCQQACESPSSYPTVIALCLVLCLLLSSSHLDLCVAWRRVEESRR